MFKNKTKGEDSMNGDDAARSAAAPPPTADLSITDKLNQWAIKESFG